jgi:hypothetical protein
MKYDWIKSVPGYLDHFDDDNRLLIEIIGIEGYLKLLEYFGTRGLYFCASPTNRNRDMEMVENLLGHDHYIAIHKHFNKSWIVLRQSSIKALMKAWLIQNKDINYRVAVRTLRMCYRTIYRWRKEA